MGESNCDAFTIQQLGGHSDIRISSRYVHPSDERKQTAFDRLQDYNAAQMKKVEDAAKKERVQ